MEDEVEGRWKEEVWVNLRRVRRPDSNPIRRCSCGVGVEREGRWNRWRAMTEPMQLERWVRKVRDQRVERERRRTSFVF